MRKCYKRQHAYAEVSISMHFDTTIENMLKLLCSCIIFVFKYRHENDMFMITVGPMCGLVVSLSKYE